MLWPPRSPETGPEGETKLPRPGPDGRSPKEEPPGAQKASLCLSFSRL